MADIAPTPIPAMNRLDRSELGDKADEWKEADGPDTQLSD
jgi:hypothetical protein